MVGRSLWKLLFEKCVEVLVVLFTVLLITGVVLTVLGWASNAFGSSGVTLAEPLDERAVRWLREQPGGRWQLHGRGEEGRIRELAWNADQAILGLEPSVTPELLLAVAYRESRWQADRTGRRGEIGLMQLHGIALGAFRRRPQLAWYPALNLRLGALHLARAIHGCLGDTGWGLHAYATGECGPPRVDKDTKVIAWAEELAVSR